MTAAGAEGIPEELARIFELVRMPTRQEGEQAYVSYVQYWAEHAPKAGTGLVSFDWAPWPPELVAQFGRDHGRDNWIQRWLVRESEYRLRAVCAQIDALRARALRELLRPLTNTLAEGGTP